MKYLKGNQIRKLFLDYFVGKGHQIVPSSPLIPADDPTLLFTNAGMVQFKGVFQGQEKRPYSRAASCQKCVRAGGKHNDLENVGYTARHHTFFEMLGNFSFGDYFKKEAIGFAWEFLTKGLQLPIERLWVTVFEEDDEAADLWPKLTGIPAERVVRLGEKDNFWAMGDTGPCGPCSEILFDQGRHIGCRRPECRVGCDCDRFLEIWNLVFMQFFRDINGRLTPLPRPCIDTGMGLERITAICQGKLNNFDTDLFAGIMEHLGHIAACTYGQGPGTDVAMRVIADHARASAFLIADGLTPSNEGRGYVLRRIIRRAVRYGRVLGLVEPFMASVAYVVTEEMGTVYPELVDARSVIGQVLTHEESRFAETLEHGLKILEEKIIGLKEKGERIIPGDFAFKLYDTYGLPVDIVQDVAKEKGLALDRDTYNEARQVQRERSKSAHRETVTEKLPEVYKRLLDTGKGSHFSGYERLSDSSRILAMVSDGIEVSVAPVGWQGELVVEQTPFYAESGGQIGDKGQITCPSGSADVEYTAKRGDLIVHRITVTDGELRLGDVVRLEVHEGLRMDTARNHTATHLLHAALRYVLGDHVKQAGSLVSSARLRFDFTHFSSVDVTHLKKVEDIVNEKIRMDLEVSTQVLNRQEALEKGAMALFGEKYGDTVRVVSIGDFSMELCGGTHLHHTGQIGLFKVLSESSVASGIRRIEACTGRAAIDFVHQIEDTLSNLAAKLKVPRTALPEKVSKLNVRIKELEREIVRLKQARTTEDLEKLIKGAKSLDGFKVLSAQVEIDDPQALRELGDKLRDRIGSGVIALGARSGSKALLLCLVTKNLIPRFHAGKLIKEMAAVIGGGGGGRPDMAQAGGHKPERLRDALEKIHELVA